jgi:hypothetical protein
METFVTYLAVVGVVVFIVGLGVAAYLIGRRIQRKIDTKP